MCICDYLFLLYVLFLYSACTSKHLVRSILKEWDVSRYIPELGKFCEKNVDTQPGRFKYIARSSQSNFAHSEKESVPVFALSSGLNIRPPSNWRSLSLALIELQLRLSSPPSSSSSLPHLVRVSTSNLFVIEEHDSSVQLLSLAGDLQRDESHQGERKLTVQDERLLYHRN